MSTPLESSPTDPQPLTPAQETPLLAEESMVSTKEEMSTSPFAKMFPMGATHAQVKEFIDQYLKTILAECRRAEARWKEAQKRLRRAMEGRRLDD